MPIWLTLSAAITAAVIAALGGFILIPFLRRIHFGQTILEEGPAWHKSKQGTPIMGGFLFIAGIHFIHVLIDFCIDIFQYLGYVGGYIALVVCVDRPEF